MALDPVSVANVSFNSAQRRKHTGRSPLTSSGSLTAQRLFRKHPEEHVPAGEPAFQHADTIPSALSGHSCHSPPQPTHRLSFLHWLTRADDLPALRCWHRSLKKRTDQELHSMKSRLLEKNQIIRRRVQRRLALRSGRSMESDGLLVVRHAHEQNDFHL